MAEQDNVWATEAGRDALRYAKALEGGAPDRYPELRKLEAAEHYLAGRRRERADLLAHLEREYPDAWMSTANLRTIIKRGDHEGAADQ